MVELEPKQEQGRSVGRNAVDRLLVAIGYPERMSNAGGPFMLRVDGKEVFVEESGDRIVISRILTEDDSLLPTLATYAAGRMLREDATFAYGRRPKADGQGFRPSAFLWQDAAADASDRDLLRLFETFMDSCDWWQERVDSFGRREDGAPPETMMIRP